MVFEELKTAAGCTAIIAEQPQRNDKVQHEPASRELLDESTLVLFETKQDQNRADRRQPGNDRENIVCKHVSPLEASPVSPCPLWLTRANHRGHGEDLRTLEEIK